MTEIKSKNHLCFIKDKEFFQVDQTVRISPISNNIDLYSGQRLCSMFVCYLNSWDRTKERILSGHISI